MIRRTEDGSFVYRDGRILHQRTECWLSRVRNHDICFSCGALRQDVVFNDEHVVPDWVLRRYDLHRQFITLPNGTQMRYGQYKVPCCVRCNSLYGQIVEMPMSRLVAGGHDALLEHIQNHGPGLLIAWLSLLVFKLHYRDVTLRYNRDRRVDEGMIGDLHEWDKLHLVHTFATMPHTGTEVSPDAIGTLGIMRAVAGPGLPSFDLMDVSHMRSIMIQLDDVLIFHNVNDAGALQAWFTDYTSRMHAPLTQVQARELGMKLAFGFASLRNPPLHRVHLHSKDAEALTLDCQHEDQPDFEPFDRAVFGKLLLPQLLNFVPIIRVDGKSNDEVKAMIEAGDFTSLFRGDGTFIDQSEINPIFDQHRELDAND